MFVGRSGQVCCLPGRTIPALPVPSSMPGGWVAYLHTFQPPSPPLAQAVTCPVGCSNSSHRATIEKRGAGDCNAATVTDSDISDKIEEKLVHCWLRCCQCSQTTTGCRGRVIYQDKEWYLVGSRHNELLANPSEQLGAGVSPCLK